MNKKIAVLILLLAAAAIAYVAFSSVIRSERIKKLGITAGSTVLESFRKSFMGVVYMMSQFLLTPLMETREQVKHQPSKLYLPEIK